MANFNSLFSNTGTNKKKEQKHGNDRITYLHYKKLVKSDHQYRSFRHEDLEEMADLIAAAGKILQPLLVRKIDADQYEIISGHKRHGASTLLVEERGFEKYAFLPCIIFDADDVHTRFSVVSTNVRPTKTTYETLHEIEEMRELLTVYPEAFPDIKGGRMVERLAEQLNMSRSTVSEFRSIANNLGEKGMEALKNEQIDKSAAVALSSLPVEEQEHLLDAGKLTHKEIKEYKAGKKAGAKKAEVPDNAKTDTDSLERADNLPEHPDVKPEKSTCPTGISSCIRQEWGTTPQEQHEGSKECEKCWNSCKATEKVMKQEEPGKNSNLDGENEGWFTEQIYRNTSKGAKAAHICQEMKGKNIRDIAEKVQEAIAPYGNSSYAAPGLSVIFHNIGDGIDYKRDGQKFHMGYERFVAEIQKLAARPEKEAEGFEPAEEPVSCFGLKKTVRLEGSLLTTKGCGNGKYDCFSCSHECGIRQEERQCIVSSCGNPKPCSQIGNKDIQYSALKEKCMFYHTELSPVRAGDGEPTPCCLKCNVEECFIFQCDTAKERKGRSDSLAAPKENETRCEKEIQKLEPKDVLQEESQKLDEWMEAYKDDDQHQPEFIKRQEIIVNALALMVNSLENWETAQKGQQKLPEMKNDEQRKAFINGYITWPIWIEQKQTGERYFRFDLPDGTSLVVKTYFHKCFDYNKTDKPWEERYKDGWGSEEYYLVKEGEYFKDCKTNMSSLVDHLKKMLK